MRRKLVRKTGREKYIYMGWLLAYSGVLVPNDAKVPVKKVFCVHKVNY